MIKQSHNSFINNEDHTLCSQDMMAIFLCITDERHPIARLKGWSMGCHSWVQISLKFYHCNCCAVCTIVSYMTVIYGESIVFFIFLINLYHWLKLNGYEIIKLSKLCGYWQNVVLFGFCVDEKTWIWFWLIRVSLVWWYHKYGWKKYCIFFMS